MKRIRFRRTIFPIMIGLSVVLSTAMPRAEGIMRDNMTQAQKQRDSDRIEQIVFHPHWGSYGYPMRNHKLKMWRMSPFRDSAGRSSQYYDAGPGVKNHSIPPTFDLRLGKQSVEFQQPFLMLHGEGFEGQLILERGSTSRVKLIFQRTSGRGPDEEYELRIADVIKLDHGLHLKYLGIENGRPRIKLYFPKKGPGKKISGVPKKLKKKLA